MKLNELGVNQVGTGPQRQRVSIGRVLPRVRRDIPTLSDPAGGQDHRFGLENDKLPALSHVTKATDRPAIVLQDATHGTFHEHIDSLMNAAVLQGTDQLQPSAVTDMGQPRIGVSAKIALQNATVLGAIENSPPPLQFANTIRCFLRVQLGHSPLVEVLAPLHRIAEVCLPAVTGFDVGQGRRDSSLRHHRVGLAQ